MIFSIPKKIINNLALPGIIIHKISHRFMCDIFKIPVYEIDYFNGCSTKTDHIIHQKTKSAKISFLIAIAPLILNSLLCMILTFPLTASYYISDDTSADYITGNKIFHYCAAIFWWLGAIIGTHACPYEQDMSNIIDPKNEKIIIKIIFAVIFEFIFVFNLIRHFSIVNLFYAFGLSLIIPYLLFG